MVIFDRSSPFRLTDHVNFDLKADVGCRGYEYTLNSLGTAVPKKQ
jgi:hypothetical protein